MYAKLLNGVLEHAPTNYTTSEGKLILNFNKNEELMKQYGFKELIDIRPSYNPETQYLSIDKYQENNEIIEVKYIINDIEATDYTPSLEERVTELEKYKANIIATLTRQLSRYLDKQIITQQEYDELITLMEISG